MSMREFQLEQQPRPRWRAIVAASSVAIASPGLRPRPVEFLKRVVDIVPGFLLLAAVGYSGKLVERAIATYGKAHHLTLAEYRVRVVGHHFRTGHIEYLRGGSGISRRRGHLRILAENRHCAAGRALSARATC